MTQEAAQKRFSTHPEDIVKILSGRRLLAKTSEGKFYFTTTFYTQASIADPNRYGRPASAVSPEEAPGNSNFELGSSFA
jgi:hypothetical protein